MFCSRTLHGRARVQVFNLLSATMLTAFSFIFKILLEQSFYSASQNQNHLIKVISLDHIFLFSKFCKKMKFKGYVLKETISAETYQGHILED